MIRTLRFPGRWAALTCSLLALAACAPQREVAPPPVPVADADDVLDALRERRRRIDNLRSMARLEVRTAEEKRKAKQLLLVSRPDRLRSEIFSPFGTIFVLTVSDGELAAWARRENKIYRGPATPRQMARYLRVGLPIPLAVDLLMGTPPLWPGAETDVEILPEQIVLHQFGSGGRSVTRFDRALEPIEYEQRDRSDRPLLHVVYGVYQDVDGARLPREVELIFPASDHRIRIELREPEVNVDFPPGVFTLATPEGVTEVYVNGGPP